MFTMAQTWEEIITLLLTLQSKNNGGDYIEIEN
jgi:hypothetical protein